MASESIDAKPVSKWCATDVPDLSGKVAIVTGANSGIGYEATKVLAAKGAHVVMACRSVDKCTLAVEKIKREVEHASLTAMKLELGDLSSVRGFASAFKEEHNSLDILCNNAAIMQAPKGVTVDGFETHLGVNHLGHFALTGLLINTILNTKNSRVVTVSSNAHKMGRFDFDDLKLDKSYGRTSAYARSKLANLLFAYDLQRKLESCGSSSISVAAHPGYAATNLQITGPGMGGGKLLVWIYKLLNRVMAQSAEMGALPILYAATAKDVVGADYIAPGGLGEWRGYPKKSMSSNASYDKDLAKKIWEISKDLTKISYGVLSEPVKDNK